MNLGMVIEALTAFFNQKMEEYKNSPQNCYELLAAQ
jgi:hypothetical protein